MYIYVANYALSGRIWSVQSLIVMKWFDKYHVCAWIVASKGDWGSRGTFSTWNRHLYLGIVVENFFTFTFIFWLGSIILFPYFQIFLCVLMNFVDITDVTLACLIGEDIKSLGFRNLNHQWLRICNPEDSGSWILKIYIMPIFSDLRILSPEDIES